MKNVKVLKFGGSSMGSAEAIERVISVIRKNRDPRVAAVVVSAMSGTTDKLIEIARLASAKDDSYKKLIREVEKRHMKAVRSLVKGRIQKEALATVKDLVDSLDGLARGMYLVHELSPAALDYLMSYGERLSAHLLTDALRSRGVKCEYLNARKLITSDASFGRAVVDFKVTDPSVRAYFKKHPMMQIVTGFIASTPDNRTTTLGRGGSDYSASIIGAALGASAIEIWTDVSGVMTADPRIVKDALPIERMTYLEASEMSYFGAKVIHPPTMRPAMRHNVPLHIKNTFEPSAPGTIVTERSADGAVKGTTSVSNIVMIQVQGSGMPNVRGASGRVFVALAHANVNVILITQASSQHSISIAVDRADAEHSRRAIEEEFALERRSGLIDPISIEHDLSILAIVGEGMKEHRGIAGRLFATLARNGINVVAIAQGSSELNISVVIRQEEAAKALNAVHAAFFASRQKVINLFLVGTGVVGSALLRQTAQQAVHLKGTYGYAVRIIGIADAERMAFDPSGISARDWKQVLHRSRQKTDIPRFIERMCSFELPGSVFVDCTASERVAERYLDVLTAGISVVTPNKCANSGPLSYYRALKDAADKHGVQFLYETNVGAGLPVLNTLRDLLISGDKVQRIEAVLSGTLSYIFDNFNGDRRFSDIVKEARELGFAEPDPRVDLSGLDVARKILILARESGHLLELDDVEVQSLLSDNARKAPSVEKFFEVLKRDDAAFEKKKASARRAGKVLRYIATLRAGKARVSLQAVDAQHPFYALYGNDNIIAFFTDRYKKSPLIVQGPGAGADVTAAGIFADILRTAANGV